MDVDRTVQCVATNWANEAHAIVEYLDDGRLAEPLYAPRPPGTYMVPVLDRALVTVIGAATLEARNRDGEAIDPRRCASFDRLADLALMEHGRNSRTGEAIVRFRAAWRGCATAVAKRSYLEALIRTNGWPVLYLAIEELENCSPPDPWTAHARGGR